MQVIEILVVGSGYTYNWPDGTVEQYPNWIDYRIRMSDGDHIAKVAFGIRDVYGRSRRRVLVMIDGNVQVEFFSTDDYEHTGEVISEIKIPGDKGERICRYLDDVIPERYSGLPVVGLATRVSGRYLHNAWAVVANVSDHRTLLALAALRRLERDH